MPKPIFSLLECLKRRPFLTSEKSLPTGPRPGRARFRADSTINQVIREVADQFSQDGVTLIDAAAAFESESLPHQPGWNLLLEHVHYDFSGNAVLANAFGKAILDRLDLNASLDHLILSSSPG